MGLDSWIWPVLLAPIIGSFLGVIVTRLDSPRSIVIGRSRCMACGGTLQALDLVPIASWLVLRGRCRHCGARIGVFHLLIEVAAIAIAAWAALTFSGPLMWVSAALGWTLLALAATDLKYYLLPDFLTLPLAVAGLLVGWILDPASLPDRMIGAAMGLLFVVGLRFVYEKLRGREGIGLGDAKLLAAAGAWVSWAGLPSVLLLAALSGLAFAFLKGGAKGALSLTDRIPFGAFLCLGIWIVWLYGPLGS